MLQGVREKKRAALVIPEYFVSHRTFVDFLLVWFLLLAEGSTSDRLVPSVTAGSTSTSPVFDFLDKTMILLYIAAVNPEPMPKN